MSDHAQAQSPFGEVLGRIRAALVDLGVETVGPLTTEAECESIAAKVHDFFGADTDANIVEWYVFAHAVAEWIYPIQAVIKIDDLPEVLSRFRGRTFDDRHCLVSITSDERPPGGWIDFDVMNCAPLLEDIGGELTVATPAVGGADDGEPRIVHLGDVDAYFVDLRPPEAPDSPSPSTESASELPTMSAWFSVIEAHLRSGRIEVARYPPARPGETGGWDLRFT